MNSNFNWSLHALCQYESVKCLFYVVCVCVCEKVYKTFCVVNIVVVVAADFYYCHVMLNVAFVILLSTSYITCYSYEYETIRYDTIRQYFEAFMSAYFSVHYL